MNYKKMLIIIVTVFLSVNLFANKVLSKKYKEAKKLISAMKMIEGEIRKIQNSPIRQYLTQRLWGYQNMLKDIKKKIKNILGLERYNFIDFNLNYVVKLREHYYRLISDIKGVHLLDSTKKIMQLLEYTIEQFLDLFHYVNKQVKINGKKLLKALEERVWQRLLQLHGQVKAKKELERLHKLFIKLEGEIFQEAIEIIRFMTRFQKPLKNFLTEYRKMNDEQKQVYVEANRQIVDMLQHIETYINDKTIELRNSKTHKPIIDKIEELIRKNYPEWLRTN